MACNFGEIFKKLQQSSTQIAERKSQDIQNEMEDPEKHSPHDQSEVSINSDISFKFKKCSFKHSLMKDERIISTTDVARIFVDGENPREPIEHIDQAGFTKEIHQNLFRTGYRTVFPIQAYSWKSISEGRSITIVSQKRSGKTITYLPALLTLLSDIDLEESSEGPIGVILASSSQEVDVIYKLCRQLVNLSKFSIITASGKWNIHETQLKLLNGCHLLITTPPCFLRLTTSVDDIKFFNRCMLKHLVFDNFDEIVEKYQQQCVQDVLKICTYGSQKSHENAQIIITTTKWKESTASMQALSCFPLVVIGDHIEAAIYAKSRFVISRLSPKEKQNQLIHHLECIEYRKHKTIVFVSNTHELENVKEIFNSYMVEYIALKSSEKIDVDEIWKKQDGSMKVVLVTDDAMISYKFKNAQAIIHFGLPKTWSVFTKRFASSFEYYKIFVTSKAKNRFTPTAIVMMDQDNIKEIPKMISFLRDHRLANTPNQMPQEILKFVEEISEAIERNKVDPIHQTPIQICSTTLKFGQCSSFKCTKRHAFIKNVDCPKYLPTKGKIKFSLMALKSPIQYVIKVIEILTTEHEGWISWSKRNADIEEELDAFQEFMSSDSNVKQGYFSVGDICAYFSAKHVKWFRVRVLSIEILDDSSPFDSKRCTIQLIDSGETLLIKSSQLMMLACRFKDLPPLVFDLRILNLAPYDSDIHFDKNTNTQLESFFKEAKNQGDIIISRIALTIQDTIFTTNFHVMKHLQHLKTFTEVLRLKQILLGKEYAVENNEIFQQLKRLALSAELEVPSYEEGNVPFVPDIGPKPSETSQNFVASYVPLVPNITYNVIIGTFKTPDSFYVMLYDFYEKVENALKDFSVQNHLTEIKNGTYCFYLPISFNGHPQRAIIRNEKKLEILLLDIGLIKLCSKDELYEMPQEVGKLPFAAIQCKLSGVKPKHDKSVWDERDIASFRHLLKNLSTSGVFEMRVSHEISQVFYEVYLAAQENRKDLARTAVKAGYAVKEISSEEIKKNLTSELTKLLENGDAINGSMSDLWKMTGLPDTAKFILPERVQQASLPQLTAFEKVQKHVKNFKEVLRKSQHELQHLKEISHAVESKQRFTQILHHPYIDWYQNAAEICLKIDACGVLEYGLEITETTLSVFLTYPNMKKYALIELYGSVQPKLSAHYRKNDLEITVRLAKRLFNIEWPRLTSAKEKNNFIAFREGEIQEDKNKTYLKGNMLPADYYDDRSGSDNFNTYEDYLEDGDMF